MLKIIVLTFVLILVYSELSEANNVARRKNQHQVSKNQHRSSVKSQKTAVARKPTNVKKPTARKPTTRKPTARKPTVKATNTRKTSARKTSVKKPVARKTNVKKPVARNPSVRNTNTNRKPTNARKPIPPRSSPKKPIFTKSRPKTTNVKKPTVKKPSPKKSSSSNLKNFNIASMGFKLGKVKRISDNECIDLAVNCEYFVGVCFDPAWEFILQKYCRLRCGFCVPGSNRCRDFSSNCQKLKNDGFCKSHKQMKLSMCAQTCNVCHSNSTPDEPTDPSNPSTDCTASGQKYLDECLPITCAKDKTSQKCQEYCNGAGRGKSECENDCSNEKRYDDKCMSITCKDSNKKASNTCQEHCKDKNTAECQKQRIDCSTDEFNKDCLKKTCAKPSKKSSTQCTNYCKGETVEGRSDGNKYESECEPEYDCTDSVGKYHNACVTNTCVREPTNVMCNERAIRKRFAGIHGKREINFPVYVGGKTGALAQKVEIAIPNQIVDSGLYVHKSAFKFIESSSYVQIGFKTNNDGFSDPITIAMDTFVFDDYMSVKTTFAIREKHNKEDREANVSLLYFNRQDNPGSTRSCNAGETCLPFVESVFKNKPDKTMIFAFNRIKQYERFVGWILIGDQGNDLCQTSWVYLPEVSNGNKNWYFNVNRISIGSYSRSTPRIASVKFGISTYFSFPKQDYKDILKILNADEDEFVSCTITNELVFNLGSGELRVQPNLFVSQKIKRNGRCQLLFDTNKTNEFYIPFVAFSEKCLMFDYANTRVGFTNRII